ncbi:MAG: Crp/Fnr family transcriptional regulator [Acidobacteriota bacterium]
MRKRKVAYHKGMDPRRSRIFDGLTETERRQWLEAARRREVRRNEPVARQGEPAQAFVLVESGFLKLLQLAPDGRELIVRFVGAGEPFGGVVVLDAAAYPVTALAVEPTRLLVWPLDVLRTLLDRFPQVRLNITREIAAHMTDALTRVRELATERVSQRLAHTLLRLMRQAGTPGPDGVLIAHPLTRQELADLTGTTLYTVSRTLSRWQAQGVLQSTRRQLLVRMPQRLEALSRAADD